MMDRAVNELDRARGRMASDLRTVITDGEDLLKAVATVSGEAFPAARAKFEEKLKNAKATLAVASQPLIDGTRRTAAVTHHYVHENPWTVIGAGIAVGALIGFFAAKR